MPSFTFEGFTIGTGVDLSATQGAETVSGAVATWGEQPAGTATIDIAQTDTEISQYDSVRFTATGWGDFDTSETHAPSGNIYKPRFHDIVYFWDTGKSGSFSAPENLLEVHKSRRYAHGPVVMVCFDQPGVYTVRLYAYEPSSEKFAFRTTTVTVNSADIEYPGTQTICINPNGDNDFSAAPPGAQTYQLAAGNLFSDSHPAWTGNIGGAKKRFLLKGGAQFNLDIDVGSSAEITSGWMIGSYGDGRAEIVNTSVAPFNFDGVGFSSKTRVLINRLIFQGNFNPTTNSGGPTSLVGTGENYHLVVHDCTIDGYGGTVFFYALDNQNPVYTAVYQHLDDVSITNPGGQYPVLGSPHLHPESSAAFTGCRIARAPDSDFDQGFSGLGGQQRATLRLNGHMWVYIQGCDIFQNTGDQPCMKIGESGLGAGVHNIQGNGFESANGGVMKFMDGTSGLDTNLIFRHNVCVQSAGPEGGFVVGILCGGRGCSFDSNLFIALGTAGSIPSQTRAAIRYQGSGNDTPNTERNNTYAHYKDGTENNSSNVDLSVNSDGYSLTQGCNIEHFIGLGSTPQAPLEDGPTGVALWQPRNTGRWNSGTFNTDWASAPLHVYAFRPESGSPALGARTTENYFPFPIDAQTEADIRPSNADFGCWQGPA